MGCMVKKTTKTIVFITSLILILLGLFVTYGTHIMILRAGIEQTLLASHAVLNLIASGLITLGVTGLLWRLSM